MFVLYTGAYSSIVYICLLYGNLYSFISTYSVCVCVFHMHVCVYVRACVLTIRETARMDFLFEQ